MVMASLLGRPKLWRSTFDVRYQRVADKALPTQLETLDSCNEISAGTTIVSIGRTNSGACRNVRTSQNFGEHLKLIRIALFAASIFSLTAPSATDTRR